MCNCHVLLLINSITNIKHLNIVAHISRLLKKKKLARYFCMSLSALLSGKRPPVLEELEVVGSGACASCVVKARVVDAGGFSRLAAGQIVAVKKVYVPRKSVVHQEQKRRRLARQAAEVANGPANPRLPSDGDDDDVDDPPCDETSSSCNSQDQRRCAAIEREVSLLKSLNHPNIVACYGVIPLEDKNMLGIVMEFCPGNSLRHCYRRRQQQLEDNPELQARQRVRTNGLPEDDVRRYTAQMLSGLAYLHANGVVHRDLKGLNVLLSEDPLTCKVADFGSATQIALSGSDARFHSMQGTVWWMAPEQFLLGKSGSSKTDCEDGAGGTFVADVWSLGCTVLELATGAIPFTHVAGGQFGLMLLLTRPQFDESELLPAYLSELIPPGALAFIKRCLVRDPAKRPTSADLLTDPWLQGAAPSPRLLISQRSSTATADSVAPSPRSSATTTTACTSPTGLSIPEGIPEKLHEAALFWYSIEHSFDNAVSISRLCDQMKCPGMAPVLAPYFAFPRVPATTAGLPPIIATASFTPESTVNMPTFLMFVHFFGPFATLVADARHLEEQHYPSSGYADYSEYAMYEETDCSHLLLSCLSKPYVKLLATQGEVEEELKTAQPGKFVVRYSSKCMESPGSLTLSVKGEHGVLHHRLLRQPDSWSFFITLPSQTSSERRSRRERDLSLLRGGTSASSKHADAGATLCFDTLEDLVKYFTANGIPSQRSDRVYRLIA